ncbi:MAG: DUF4169 family protein [Rhizobiaceae bacterium]
MGEVINLRAARKSKARITKEAQAAENRIKFGRTLADKKQHRTQTERDKKALDGHLLTSEKDSPQ